MDKYIVGMFSENGGSLLDEKRVKSGMSDVLRQIVAAVSFLPNLETECSFDVMVGVKRGSLKNSEEVDFETIKDHKISNAETVQLRSFTTGHHDVKASVEYKSDL